jgi:predicted  nucleic acid-binding Zn-ribbon protein
MSGLQQILIFSVSIIFAAAMAYFIAIKITDKRLKEYKTIKLAVTDAKKQLAAASNALEIAKELFEKTDKDTKELQQLRNTGDELSARVESSMSKLSELQEQISKATAESENRGAELYNLMSKVDLYSRLDEFVDRGHFEMPEYLHQTSARFVEEIKRVREKQKALISDKMAVTYPDDLQVVANGPQNKKILQGQTKLMLTAFNIECDSLIGKVGPSSFSRTLERIEKLANTIEKSAASLQCGLNIKYIELKFDECKLQYQSSLKKKEEQDEQRLIREQIREEQKAIKEYERAISQAEKEERMYRDMLKRAREELSTASADERLITEQKIADLENQLAEAEAKEARAKSMAEQTRKGHVYIISNVGSFGDGVYKIGLTRRLEPMDRVKELGDASVPFIFDVHALIYVDDAPALESALHREFSNNRVNSVNYRKEFFRIDLPAIKQAVEKLGAPDAEFKMTALAEEYYESRRLQGESL